MKGLILKVIAFTVILSIASTTLVTQSPDFVSFRSESDVTPADTVWLEDFDDGNISEWGIYAIAGEFPYNNPPGNFTVKDGALRVNGSDGGMSIANRSSQVAYGTWDFDIDVVDTSNDEIVIYFLSQKWNLTHWGIDGYFLLIVTGEYNNIYQPRLKPGKVYAAPNERGRLVQWYQEYPYNDILGWKHFTITRQGNGQFYIYMNGTLACGFKDNQHTTCNQFCFASYPGPAIDNINVSNTVDVDKAPPEWESLIPNYITITEGESFYFDANATDYSGIDKWWIDDTENFTINQEGVITNNVVLSLGDYSIGIWVNDTLGNIQHDRLGLSVMPSTTTATTATTTTTAPSTTPTTSTTTTNTGGGGFPIQSEILLIATGGIIIIVLVILFVRKR